MKATVTLISLLSLSIFFSCNTDDLKDLDDVTISHEGDYAVSIGSITFTMADLMENDSNLTADGNNGLKLVHREQGFLHLTAADLLDELTGDINETFAATEQVSEIELDDIVEDSFVEFGDILFYFNDQSLVDFFQSSNGTAAPVPAFIESPDFEQNVPPFSNYSSLTLSGGVLKLSLTNNLTFGLQDIEVDIFDVAKNQVLGTLAFADLPVGSTKGGEIDLTGKTIGNTFRIIWKSIGSPGTGSNPVMIDLNQQLLVFLKTEDFTIASGTAKIPEGDLVEGTKVIDFDLDNGEQLRTLELNDVEVTYELLSDIPANMAVRLELPNVTKGGSPLVHEFTVAASNPMGTLDFTNTKWQLDQDATQPYNRMEANFKIGIPAGGSGLVDFAAGDEITIRLNIKNMDVEEVTGYFGSYMENFENTDREFGFDFGFLTSESSPLFFSDPVLRIDIENSFGIPMTTTFEATATGLNGDQLPLDPPNILINHPTQIGQSAHTLAVLNKMNSGIVDFLSVYPTTVTYEGVANVNPNANPSPTNFIRSDSRLEANLEFCLPFKFSAENLVYRDTGAAPDLGLENGNFTIDDIVNAEMKVVYENGIPMGSKINLIALDADGMEKTVIENITFNAADPGANGTVEDNEIATGSELFELGKDQLHALNDASFYIYELILQTGGGGQEAVTIYLDYFVEMGFGLMFTVKPN